MTGKEAAWNDYRQACNRASALEGNVRATKRIAEDMVKAAMALRTQAWEDIRNAIAVYDLFLNDPDEGEQP